ncbi:MAG: type II toxin-antitoxin system VapC family toxin [Candidatus Celaenobacter polaris]|nr:type II toxin-antitoxin system VapC family toxin [Candidatus Celaenobacter polaris]
MKYMLDTNICIYLIKKKPQKRLQKFKQFELSQLGISSITFGELLYGVYKSSEITQNKLALAQFVTPLEIAPYNDEAADYYGKVRTFLEKRGTPIGSLDMLIAAHALSLGCILVTNSVKEFSRIPNLKIENWAK